jgi:hypothetical protein
MTRKALLTVTILSALALVSSQSQAAIETSDDLKRVAEAFYELEIDPARFHEVTDAVITRDITTIKLKKGVIAFSKAIEGVTPIAIFMGTGNVTITPVRPMDRDMLNIQAKQHLKKDVGGMINSALSELMIVAYDHTWEELLPHLSEARSGTAREMKGCLKILKNRLSELDRVGSTLEFGVISSFFADPQVKGGTFHAEMDTEDFGWINFAWSPASTYEVSLSSREAVGAYFMSHNLIDGHKKADLDAKGRVVADPVADLHDAIDVKRYRMDIEVPNLQEIFINADVTFEPLVDDMKLIGFSLVNDIRGPRWDSRAKWIDVKSLTDSEGNELPYIHRKNAVIIIPKNKPVKGEEMTLSFQLHENTITQLSNVHFSLLNTYSWFPQSGYLGGTYEFDWTVKTVKPLSATGSGTPVKRWEEGNMNAVQMIFDRPVQFPSVIFGRYQVEEGEYTSPTAAEPIPIRTHSWPKTVYKFTDAKICSDLNIQCPIDFELTVPRKKPADIILEGKQIIKFMEDLYGPYPYEKLDVAMMAPGMGFGQAPPSFVQLTGEAFMSSAAIADRGGNPDFFHGFFSHEIAHQWWGHKIGWVSDDDQWLSEAFAEYSAGLYVLSYLGEKAWKDKMENWRQNAEIGDPHGSIAFSNRLSGPRAMNWYVGLIYNKGPYVVHMLRMQMGLENFKTAMQAVFEKYGYTNISTYQLQRECENVAGYNLDFFFDQWFRGTGIPTFDYSWESTETDDGKHLVTVKIDQRDKENFKKVLMPVYFYFKGTDEPLIRPRPILTASDTFQLKLPQKPSRVVLDEDKDILGYMIPSGHGAGL